MSKIEEDKEESKETDTPSRGLLEALKLANVKIHLLSGSLDKLYTKKKFTNLFDIGVLSINSANMIKRDLSILFKDHAKVHVESADFIVIMKPEQRQEFRKKLLEKIIEARWTRTPIEKCPFKHHELMEVHHIAEERLSTASTEVSISS